MKVYTHCIYIPTCSEYALEAIEKYGAFKGGLLTVWRILRCNPFAKGGYDPVPELTYEPSKHQDGNVSGGKIMTGPHCAGEGRKADAVAHLAEC